MGGVGRARKYKPNRAGAGGKWKLYELGGEYKLDRFGLGSGWVSGRKAGGG